MDINIPAATNAEEIIGERFDVDAEGASENGLRVDEAYEWGFGESFGLREEGG